MIMLEQYDSVDRVMTQLILYKYFLDLQSDIEWIYPFPDSNSFHCAGGGGGID